MKFLIWEFQNSSGSHPNVLGHQFRTWEANVAAWAEQIKSGAMIVILSPTHAKWLQGLLDPQRLEEMIKMDLALGEALTTDKFLQIKGVLQDRVESLGRTVATAEVAEVDLALPDRGYSVDPLNPEHTDEDSLLARLTRDFRTARSLRDPTEQALLS